MGIAVSIRKRLGTFTLDAEWTMGDELAVLFGRSGAGKSLTLRAIAGLMTPDEGAIVIGQRTFFSRKDRRDLPPRERSVGYMFQDLALFPHMTVEENILFGGHGIERRERRERCAAMVRRFGLSGLEHLRPGALSGGQRQRVAFARALLRRPRALLLDEPFSALDEHLRRDMRSLLKDVQREYAVPVVLVTHDREEALAIADRIIVYAGGRVLRSGQAEVLSVPPPDVSSCSDEDKPQQYGAPWKQILFPAS